MSKEPKSYFQTEEESESRFSRKFRENPFFPIGIAGFTCAVVYGLWGIRNRPKGMPLSLYLIHLRVGAQGVAVGTLAVGVTYMLGKRIYNKINGIDDYDPNHR